MNLFPNGGSIKEHVIVLQNTKLSFASTSQFAVIGGGRLYWLDTASAIAGTVPTTLFSYSSATGSVLEISGVDLSAAGSGKNLINGAATAGSSRAYLRNCKLGASVSVITGTVTSPGGIEVFMDNCDSGSTNYRHRYRRAGSFVPDINHRTL